MTRRAAALLLLGSAFVLVLASTSTLAGAAAGRVFAASIPSQVAPPADWNGVGCRGWKTTSAAKFVCNYDVEAPFSLTGYSTGGMSTLSYVVQCKKTSAAPQRVVMYPRVWYGKSQKVAGNFKVYGVKATQDAAKHCDIAEGRDPVLAITLKMGNGVGKVMLNVKIDSAMAWAK